MHIAIVTDYYPPDRIGGVGEIAARLREAYIAAGHRVTVITSGTMRAEEAAVGIRRIAPSLGRAVLAANATLVRLMRDDPVDVVHLNHAASTLFLLMRLWWPSRPAVISSLQVSYISEAREVRSVTVAGERFRPGWSEYVAKVIFAPVHYALDAIGFVLADVVTTVSRDNREELARHHRWLTHRPVHIVPNGVPATRPEPAPLDAAWVQRLAGAVVIGCIGVFRQRKRIPLLLAAFARVVARVPEARLLIVGGGRGNEERYRQLATRLGVADRVDFTGPIPPARVADFVARMDIVALLSSYEGMPMVMLEAMQAGKPVVMTDAYGMRDALETVDPEALVPVDNEQAAAERLIALAESPALRATTGAALQAHVERRYGWSRVADSFLTLAESVRRR